MKWLSARALLQIAFYRLLVRGLMKLFGFKIIGSENLPTRGGVIIIANHHSSADMPILGALLPMECYQYIRPVGAIDYLKSGWFFQWFSTYVLQVIPLNRNRPDLRLVLRALEEQAFIIMFPEGTRKTGPKEFNSGIGWISNRAPQVPIYPVYLEGTAKLLPRESWRLRPTACRVVIGEPITFPPEATQAERVTVLQEAVYSLKSVA